MRKSILSVMIVSLGIVVFCGEVRAQGIKEGNWSISVVTQMAGMSEQSAEAQNAMENMSPEEKAMMQQMMGGMGATMNANGMGITTTITQCVTNENPVPQSPAEEGCQQTHSINGSTVNFETICDDSRSNGQITYANDSMSGTINSRQMENGTETNSTIQITGQYVGPCS